MRQTQQILVGGNEYEAWKVDGNITDADVGKPVKISATDLMTLCSDGDQIDGWIDSVGNASAATADGKALCAILVEGRIKVILSGAADNIGQMVEAAANTAAGSANAGDFALVSKHVPDTTSAATLLASTFPKNWRIISGALTDGATVLLESCF